MPVFRVTMLQSVRVVADVTADDIEDVWHKMAMEPDKIKTKQEQVGAVMESIVQLNG